MVDKRFPVIILRPTHKEDKMNTEERKISRFGRQMMDLAAMERNDAIANALSRVGEHLAEKASIEGLTDLDKKVIRYANQKIN